MNCRQCPEQATEVIHGSIIDSVNDFHRLRYLARARKGGDATLYSLRANRVPCVLTGWNDQLFFFTDFFLAVDFLTVDFFFAAFFLGADFFFTAFFFAAFFFFGAGP